MAIRDSLLYDYNREVQYSSICHMPIRECLMTEFCVGPDDEKSERLKQGYLSAYHSEHYVLRLEVIRNLLIDVQQSSHSRRRPNELERALE